MNIKMPADCFVPRLVTENADGDMPTSLSNSVLETWTLADLRLLILTTEHRAAV
jgi:hypothetical protein